MARGKYKNKGQKKLPTSVKDKILNLADTEGLEHVLSKLFSELQYKYDTDSGHILCGYSNQPIYTNKEYTKMINACALDYNKLCEYITPKQEQIYLQCPIYQKVVLGK